MNLNNIKIFVLVGGFGTRLKNIVSDVPKPMAPINKKPFLAYKIENDSEVSTRKSNISSNSLYVRYNRGIL